jgi:hypothetical protein
VRMRRCITARSGRASVPARCPFALLLARLR